MEDLNDPQRPRWRKAGAVGATWRMPVPPGPSPELTSAQREQEARAEARAEARLARLHLPGLLSVGVTVMGLLLAAVIVLSMVALTSHR
jgi:hypothetical protein